MIRLAVSRWPLLAAPLTLLFLAGCVQEEGNPLKLTAPQALEQATAGTVALVDIRTPEEWRQTGVPSPAIRLDMRQPGGPDGFARALRDQAGIDPETPVALICRTGNRSAWLQRELHARGFTNIYDVSEGMAGSRAGPGWVRQGLPVSDCRPC